VKKQVVYVAEDGREFDSQEECKRYEASYSLVDYLAKVLPADVDAAAVADALRSDITGLRRAIKSMRSPRGSRKSPGSVISRAEGNGGRARPPF
jgi:hypothetical protein